jgi:hypothetical protein
MENSPIITILVRLARNKVYNRPFLVSEPAVGDWLFLLKQNEVFLDKVLTM